MAETTGIEWCDSTFNPWIGCEKVSPGCAHCYAETLVTGRMGRAGTWGADGVRQRTSPGNWKKPLAWERDSEAFLAEHGHRRRVFCASLADVFEPRPELELWRSDLFDLVERTPSLDWLILTKRPDLAGGWLRSFYEDYHETARLPFLREWTGRDHLGWGVLPNIWIGTSIENARHTWRADTLREIPAAVRFISAEPLLGSLFETRWSMRASNPAPDEAMHIRQPLDLTDIDWLIVGGESGPGHRPMRIEWARELRDACADEGVAFFFKQWGGRMAKTGGKILDGREWCEMPGQAVTA